ncbi:hypothetical protein ISN45_Aa05g010780 [Arabidopsis thaliana x Arabidopsis arenosa]|uniref:Transmembrane protein n=1 Tax=Arabidopsis thaliana x Arabidopsis arenosa TaxID=1240361 RepID=A0A8T1ZJK0_9BRAS|nr:hypothetical protein ISN45_Aa05g010780 [Arabidopsis thaliana x Arabidopsis arenosa]
MAANKRRLLHCVSKRVSIAGVRRSYGGVPQSNFKSLMIFGSIGLICIWTYHSCIELMT